MAFQQGLSGLNTSSKALDVTSNNIANASTVGFKSAVSHFADVYAASLTGAGASQIGIGSSLSAIAQQFTQGNITTTSNSLDIAINGQGFFRLSQDGAIRYSRNGQFHLDAQGYVVNDKRENLTGYLADAGGNIIPSTPTAILIDPTPIPPRATGSTNIGVSYALNLDSTAQVPAVAWTAPTGVNAPQTNTYNFTDAVTIYDSLGNAHTMTMYFVKTATAGQWQVHFQVDGTSEANVPGSPRTLNFNSSGQLTTLPMPIAGFSVNLAGVTADLIAADPTTPPNSAAPLSFNLDFTDSTQYGADFANSKKTQDGYSAGQLTSMTVGQDGVVQGVYSNGQTRNLAQLVLANFRNPNGLMAIGNNDFIETSDSGQPLVGTPKSGTLGVVQSGAVEDSNVDLTAELVNMIVQQRNYQANAQSIKTQDQIMQTLVNIR
ncbi:flagellar hook protein FlgE [Azonexus sp. IMCC34839]|uniref:flagellar hook protein FlgE n=1 Tax=Azonexus sp. IMCC34839 TaxID=3133695 RepID=UPI00399AA459